MNRPLGSGMVSFLCASELLPRPDIGLLLVGPRSPKDGWGYTADPFHHPMEETFDRPLSLSERVQKARRLLEEGLSDFQATEEAEAELGMRKRASEACQKAFHALVVLADGLLEEHGLEARSHDERMEKLQDIGREDLATLYGLVIHALHTSGYDGQRIGRIQRQRLQELRAALEEEFAKLG